MVSKFKGFPMRGKIMRSVPDFKWRRMGDNSVKVRNRITRLLKFERNFQHFYAQVANRQSHSFATFFPVFVVPEVRTKCQKFLLFCRKFGQSQHPTKSLLVILLSTRTMHTS